MRWIQFGLAVFFGACASPQILGGPTPATTTHTCQDGTVCPNGYDCPAPFSKAPCQIVPAITMQWGEAIKDAGKD